MAEDEKRNCLLDWSGDREVQYLIEKIIAQVENSKTNGEKEVQAERVWIIKRGSFLAGSIYSRRYLRLPQYLRKQG